MSSPIELYLDATTCSHSKIVSQILSTGRASTQD